MEYFIPFHPLDIDVRRAVFDMEDDYSTHETDGTYLAYLHEKFKGSAAMKRIMSPIDSQRSAAFKHRIGAYSTNHFALNGSHSAAPIPALYLSDPFKNGVAIGMEMNHRMLGDDMDNVLTPHIDVVMPKRHLSPQDYAASIKDTGMRAFARVSHESQIFVENYPPELRNFVNNIGHRLYNNEQPLTHLKVGAGLAYTAYRSLQDSVNQACLDIYLNSK